MILNKEDLIYSTNPRIIKLHGSFPSTLPFIITEEDYRQYPKNSAIFVNTVQQTLIENALCLVGFSGDDPNFLQWIGWIRDNIGKDIASKIYLVGIFNFSTAQLNLLNKRNIVVLNMANCPNVTDHYTALELFFDALKKLMLDDLVRLTGLPDRELRSIITRRMKYAPLHIALKLTKATGVPLEVWAGDDSYEIPELSAWATEVARAYDKASLKDRNTARLALGLETVKE